MRLLSEKQINAPPEIQEKLRLGNEKKVYYYEGLRQIGKNPYSFFNIYVPFHIGKLFTRSDLKSTKTFFNLIEEKTGTQIIEADQVITVSIVSKKVSEYLKMKIGEPILSAERIYFSEERMPIEIAISYYRPELYQYKVKLIRRIFMK
jgi:GntR family transcriptional regulator